MRLPKNPNWIAKHKIADRFSIPDQKEGTVSTVPFLVSGPAGGFADVPLFGYMHFILEHLWYSKNPQKFGFFDRF